MMRTGERTKAIKQVSLADVKERDSVLIGTLNHTYRFSMIDAGERKGTLTGGRLGDGLYPAIAFGSIGGDDQSGHRDFAGLRTAARAVFCIHSPQHGLERFTTSVIIDLAHLRNDEQ
jgi:hypothetical protein